jgi:hypothetical protein
MSPGNVPGPEGPARNAMAARAIAVLKMSNKVKTLITYAQSVATSLSANATSFPAPTPSVATFQVDIAALVTAETAVLARTKGAVESLPVFSRESRKVAATPSEKRERLGECLGRRKERAGRPEKRVGPPAVRVERTKESRGTLRAFGERLDTWAERPWL